MRDAALALVVQLESHNTEPGASSDKGRVVLAQRHIMPVVELDDQVAIITTQTHRGIAVAAALGGNLDAAVDTALHGLLDVLGGRGIDNSARGDGETQVVRHNSISPVVGARVDVVEPGVLETGVERVLARCQASVQGRGRRPQDEGGDGEEGLGSYHLQCCQTWR